MGKPRPRCQSAPGSPASLYSTFIHSLVHSFHSLSKYVFNAHEVPGIEQDMGTQRGAGGGHCPCPVLGASRAARVPSASPTSEQVREHDQAWVQVWECPWLRAEDVGQGHFLEEPDDDIVRGRLGRRAA